MPRTTINIEAPLLRELKKEQRRSGKTLGQIVSELLAEALARKGAAQAAPRRFQWVSRPMGARVDLADKEALQLAPDPSDLAEARSTNRLQDGGGCKWW